MRSFLIKAAGRVGFVAGFTLGFFIEFGPLILFVYLIGMLGGLALSVAPVQP